MMDSKEKALCLAAIALMRARLDFIEKDIERLEKCGIQGSFFIGLADRITGALARLSGDVYLMTRADR